MIEISLLETVISFKDQVGASKAGISPEKWEAWYVWLCNSCFEFVQAILTSQWSTDFWGPVRSFDCNWPWGKPRVRWLGVQMCNWIYSLALVACQNRYCSIGTIILCKAILFFFCFVLFLPNFWVEGPLIKMAIVSSCK